MTSQTMKQGIKVTCSKCGYTWIYKGKHQYHTKCPVCHASVWLKLKLPAMKEGIKLKCPLCNYEWVYTGKRAYAQCPSCITYIRLPNISVKASEIPKIRNPAITRIEKAFGIRIREDLASLIEEYEKISITGYSRYAMYLALAYVIIREKLGIPVKEFIKELRKMGISLSINDIKNILQKLGIKLKPIDIISLVDRYAKLLVADEKITQKAKEIAVQLNKLGGKNPVAVALSSIHIADKFYGSESIQMKDLVKFGVTEVTIRNYRRMWLKMLKGKHE
jgi:ribosomal protein S27E/DNA-binding transcriptional MerR regulator